MPLSSSRRARWALAPALALVALQAGPSAAWQAAPAAVPPPVRTAHAMVAAADPRAVDAGVAVLRAGGTAVDAAVAVQAVLGLVEPQSSGLGGGAFMTWLDGGTGRLTVYDGRETAPAAAGPDLFVGPDGKELGFAQAVLSGRSTGAPGAIAMLELAQREHGRRPWRSLWGEAERLADGGFVVGARLANAAARAYPQAQAPDAKRYFTKSDGTPIRQGDLLKNPAYADTVRRIAREGSAALLRGEIARDLVARTREGIAGSLTEADLAGYKPLKREALCRPYRKYQVCAPPPPAGGVGVLEILGLLERTDIAKRGPADPQAWVLFAQASRLSYADRDRYVGDPAFVSVPLAGMTAPAYLDDRARLVATLGGSKVQPGAPPGAPAVAADRTAEPGGTTHFVIADAFGNVVSMTTTVESGFGSGRMTHGFFLNNQLTDFSWGGRAGGAGPHPANAPGAGKRPRSSMSPAILLDARGRFVAAVGSPGGNSIIAYVAKAIVGFVDWGMPMQAAVSLPNLVARGEVASLEAGAAPEVAAAIRAAGVTVRADAGEVSGLHAIVRRPGGFEGAADPRREGVARGY